MIAGDDATVIQKQRFAAQVACAGVAGYSICLQMGPSAAVLPDAPYLVTFLAFGYSNLRRKKQEKVNIMASFWGAQKETRKHKSILLAMLNLRTNPN